MKILIKEKHLKKLIQQCIKEFNQYDEFGFQNEPDDKEPTIDDIQQIEHIINIINNMHLIDTDMYGQELIEKLKNDLKNDQINVDLIKKLKNRINPKIANILNGINLIDLEFDRIVKEYSPEEPSDISF